MKEKKDLKTVENIEYGGKVDRNHIGEGEVGKWG